VRRKSEEERFEPFKKMDNRMLLWHGSGIGTHASVLLMSAEFSFFHSNNRPVLRSPAAVNFNGILSSGLRIAPKEADISGAAFGRGIYFADSFQKSLGYCRDFEGSYGFLGNAASQQQQQQQQQQRYGGYGYHQRQEQPDRSAHNSKLLLLCEVAVGTPYLAHNVEYMDSAKPGFDSTKAVGSHAPNPDRVMRLPDGVILPNSKIQPVPVPADWRPTQEKPRYHCTRK
jgi:hypothetical protein